MDVEENKGVPEGYRIRALVEAGATGAEAVDYLITEHHAQLTQSDWAETRDTESNIISKNISSVKKELSD